MMFENNFTDINRNTTSNIKLCMKSCYSPKYNSCSNGRQNGFVSASKVSKNGYRTHENKCSSPTNLHCFGLAKFNKLESTWDDEIPCPVLSFHKACLVTFTIAILCFANSYNANFVFDDSEAIVNNNDIQLGTPLSKLFLNDFWGTTIFSNSSHKSFRPLTILSFRLNHWLHGSLEPHVFHLANIILHALVCVLVIPLFATVLSTSCKSRNFSFIDAYRCSPRASLLCAILFATHPIHTESVAGVVGRAELLCALCFVFSFLLYVKSCASSGVVAVLTFIFSIMFSLMSLLCKEQGITVLERFCSMIVRLFFLIISTIFMLLGRWYVMGGIAPSFQRVDNPASFMNSLLLRVINYNYIYSINIWLLIHPLWLCFDWSMGCVPLITSLLDPRFSIVLMFWGTVIYMTYSTLFLVTDRHRKILIMSAALMIVPFLPASNVFFRVGFVIAERVLYIPSLGYCLLVILGFHQICQQFTKIQRCSEWNNESLLFHSGLKVCPLNAKVHYNIAKTAADSGDRNTAVLEYSEAIKLNPDYDQALNNLANILKDNGQLIEAEKLLLNAIYIRPDFAAAWMNLGIVQASLRKHNDAEKSYLIALSHRKRYPDCLYNLGNLYLEMQRYDDAYRVWKNATILKPTQTAAWNNMVIMLDSIDFFPNGSVLYRSVANKRRKRRCNLKKAVEVAEEALYILPSEASLHFNFANTLGKLSQYEESELHFIQAIKLKSDNPTYYTNLGVLYHRWKKYDKAEKAYQMALKINQNAKSAQENLELLRKQLSKHRGK
ncbi:Transmembrane and TPR repeat-containing protein 4 [Nymphon striatum]|nr:Transmembrane and TPR repeat-containing protein 4 [Nymphon striatum]